MQHLQMETIRTHLPGVLTTGIFSGMWLPPKPPKSTIKPFNSRLQVTPSTSTFDRFNTFGGVVLTQFPAYTSKSGVPHPFLRGYKGDDWSFNKSNK